VVVAVVAEQHLLVATDTAHHFYEWKLFLVTKISNPVPWHQLQERSRLLNPKKDVLWECRQRQMILGCVCIAFLSKSVHNLTTRNAD